MRLVALLSLSVALGVLPAYAGDEPASSAASPAQTTSTTPTAAPPAATSPPSSTAPTNSSATAARPATNAPAADSGQAADEKRLLAMGYRRQVRDGQVTFCRKEVVLGSHFEKKVCGTAEQLVSAQQLSKDLTSETQRNSNPLSMNDFQLENGGKH